jgi:hypothetical protein
MEADSSSKQTGTGPTGNSDRSCAKTAIEKAVGSTEPGFSFGAGRAAV